MVCCVTCHEEVQLGRTWRGALIPLQPGPADRGALAVTLPAGDVRYLRGTAPLNAGETRMVAHWDIHPECKPGRPRKAKNRGRWEHLTREVLTA